MVYYLENEDYWKTAIQTCDKNQIVAIYEVSPDPSKHNDLIFGKNQHTLGELKVTLKELKEQYPDFTEKLKDVYIERIIVTKEYLGDI